MNYTKIVLTVLIGLSTSLACAMQYASSALRVASDMKDLLITPEAKTVLTTAALLGGLYTSYKVTGFINGARAIGNSSLLAVRENFKKTAQDTIEDFIVYKVRIGISLAFAEMYGSWPKSSSMVPFLIALGIAGTESYLYQLYKKKGYAAPKLQQLTWTLGRMNEWAPYCVLGAIALTSVHRYRMAQS